jgi:SAM-dependent methyltransferase
MSRPDAPPAAVDATRGRSPDGHGVDSSLPPGNFYDKVGTQHPVERRLVAGFSTALASLLPRETRHVLEVGCGEGHQMRSVAEHRPHATVVGVDIAGASWLSGWHTDGRRVAVADATSLPFSSQTFDLVLALEVLEHVPEPRQALAEMARVCGGSMIISVPWEPVWRAGNMARGRYLSQLGNTPGHIQHFTRRGILRVVREYFDVEAVKRPLPWTFVRARARNGR